MRVVRANLIYWVIYTIIVSLATLIHGPFLTTQTYVAAIYVNIIVLGTIASQKRTP